MAGPGRTPKARTPSSGAGRGTPPAEPGPRAGLRVRLLEVEGYRGINHARIVLPDHGVLLGANNVGKSSVVDALGLLLGRDKLIREIGEYDFYGGNPAPTSRIAITATLVGFRSQRPEDTPEWFSTHSAGVPFWWDTRTRTVVVEPAEGRDLCVRIRFAARWDRESAEAETTRYFLDGDADPFGDETVRPLRPSHVQEVGFFLLPSNRTWDRVLSFASELFRRVVRVQDAIPGDALANLRAWLLEPNVKLEQEAGLKDIVSHVEGELRRVVGPTAQRVRFLPTTCDTPGLMAALTPFVQGDDGFCLPMGRQGSGLVSLQTLLLLLELGRFRGEKGENFVLAAEEPELHLHPGQHTAMVTRMRGVAQQSLATTHSPVVAACYRPDEIVVLHKREGQLQASALLPEGAPLGDQRNGIMRLYTLHRRDLCEALMHRLVVVPEGLTEFCWLRLLQRAVESSLGWSVPEGLGASVAIGVLPTQDSQVVQTSAEFSKIVPRLLPLLDGDGQGDEYAKQIRGLDNRPARIAQLANGETLESALAWVLYPDTDDDRRGLEGVLGASPPLDSRSALADRLSAEDVKRNWGRHEELSGLLFDRPKAAQRAREFLRGLAQVAAGESSSEGGWTCSAGADAKPGELELWRWRGS